MSDAPPSHRRWRSSWLAVLAGVVVHFGTATLLVYVLLFAADLASTIVDPAHLDWRHRLNDASTGGWYVLQAFSFLSGVAAGLAAAALSPPRSRVALGALLFLALLSVFFAQLPSPHSILAIGIWALATPLGLLLGHRIHRQLLH
ncbi:hypothetical protein [Mitsuaria sp. GD03876]|uniref:hypothetical protein n=1 Tax=Mitsuaria sp. GD03876 TaxID=2975399 RepID=UPI00244BD1DF|nr:hypothetical protein [Mitsuaria sp. GD03876]MDH0867107.1 hypothetical protein [Mitsuaria sp. GD03876]